MVTRTQSGRGQVSDGPLEQRATQRTRLNLTASLSTVTRKLAVTLRDISANGAMVEAPILPLVGTTVNLMRGRIDVIATVAWAEPGRCGLEFHEPIDDSDVIEQLNCPDEPTFAAARDYFWRLRECEDKMSAAEWEMARYRALRSGLQSKS